MCGNWGLLCLAEFASQLRRRGEPLPAGAEKLITEMVHVIEMRGAQAGGVNFSVPNAGKESSTSIRVRVTKPKRGDLCSTLFALFHKVVARQSLGSYVRSWLPFNSCGGAMKTVLVQGHSRFGTSSPPAVNETHPHQWSPTSRVMHWAWDTTQNKWKRCVSNCALVITHNGDFDAWRPYRDTTVGLDALSCWLDRVLDAHNDAKGDSPKAAGVLELLVCQGVWLHSVRLAYHLFIACHVEQASGWMPMSADAPRTVPNKSVLQTWANALDKEFGKFMEVEAELVGSRHPFAPECGLLEDFVEKAEVKLREGPSGKLLREWVPDASVTQFITTAAEAFRDNDLLAAVTAFLRRATGTFGLTASSTLHPETIILSAKGQPMSIGFGGEMHNMIPSIAAWSSEPAALTTVAKLSEELGTHILARFDLDDQRGEVIQLSVRNTDQGRPIDDNDNGFVLTMEPGGKRADVQGDYLEVHGLHFGAAVEDEEQWAPTVLSLDALQARLKWLEGGEINTHKKRTSVFKAVHQDAKRVVDDIIVQDIQHTPGLVGNIDLNWTDVSSRNSIAAKEFAQSLIDTMKNSRTRDHSAVKQIDLLVLGVESSLWIAQQFVADLTRIFPNIHAVAMSSNVVLGLLQHGPGHVNPGNWIYSSTSFGVTHNTIGLAVSHSGTTYPTVWATRHLCKRADKVWGMSGSFDCLLANSIASSKPREEGRDFNRFFSTFAGVRTAEAATLTTVAMHHTFSQLLLTVSAHALSVELPSLLAFSREDICHGHAQSDAINEGERDPLVESMCVASAEDILDVHRLVMGMFWSCCTICGVDVQGNKLPAKEATVHEELKRMGRRWSHHITEGYWATFIPAAYVILTVVSGILPVTTLVGFIIEAYADATDEWVDYLWYITRAADAAIYVFNPIIVAMIHRLFTGRRLWARFTTRTLCIVECTVNYKLLRAYASKLLALTWRFATMGVIGQNGTDHFVHEYTHKAQSDVLCAVGLPDGRLTSLASAEACTMMSLQQAKFIKKKDKGIEAYSLGHNRWHRPGVFSESLKLPTNRPLFASELKLMPDQLGRSGNGSEGTVKPGMHGLAPTTIGQRWHDLMRQNLDAHGMTRVDYTFQDLKGRLGGEKPINLVTATQILEEILKQTLGSDAVNVTLGLKSFLQRFYSAGMASTNVFVHSPAKEYVAPVLVHSPDKSTMLPVSTKTAGDALMNQMAAGFAQADGVSKGSIADHTPGQAVRMRLSQRLAEPHDKGHGAKKSAKAVSAPSGQIVGKEELTPHEFMALVHGDELQTWVRESRNRWGKLRTIRGLLAYFGSDHTTNQQISQCVFIGGVTMGMIVASWRTITKDGKKEKKKIKRTDSAKVAQALENALAMKNGENAEDEHAVRGSTLIGQSKMNEIDEEARLISSLALTERLYESRVGSQERLMGWFVLFHAMAEPSTRLPVLTYDIGVSESRLRVASTPAPVPNHGDPEESHMDEDEGAMESMKDEALMFI